MQSTLATCVWSLLVVYFAFCINCNNAQWFRDDISCKTPDGKEGKCIDLRQCQPILALLKTLRRPHPPAIMNKLNAYKCSSGSYKVCCPSGPINLDPQTPQYNLEVAPDVSSHKNIDLLPKDCGFLDKSIRITKGTNAGLNEFPWMALLQYRTSAGLEFLCGGTIINSNYVLTAAHCLGLKDAKLVSVRVGEHSIHNETDCEVQDDEQRTLKCNPPVQDLKVEEIILHPQYEGGAKNARNDIALLRVSKMTKAENVFPVCLPIGEIRDRPFRYVYVTGWGLTNSETHARADILQKVGLPVIDKTTCSATYSENNIEITKTQICAGGVEGKASCSGDSGGPLLVATFIDGNFIYVQRGVVSIGPSFCGTRGYPGVYTLVKYYMDWILDNMKP